MPIFSAAILPSLFAGLAGSVLGGLLTGGKETAPAPPPVEAPKAVPTADSTAVAAAKKKAALEQQARAGRASTILTDDSDKLGG